MSNTLAIAAVTATLRALITQEVLADPDLADATVTVQPPDKARGSNTANQINLFLYQTAPNAAWRNMDSPWRTKPNETAMPLLPLDLYYLITPYGRDNDDIFSHRLLAHAMSLLNDNPVLSQEQIKAATATTLPASDLANQIEKVRFTLQPLSIEEIFRLWSGFQTQYRLSAGYEASVVLIDSNRSTRTPLPVLKRGADDRGASSQPDLVPPFPTLETLVPPNAQSSVRLGDLLTLTGHNLSGDNLTVRFNLPRLLAAPLILTAQSGATDTRLTVQLPDATADWATGLYNVSVVVGQSGQLERSTNELPLALAPRVTTVTPNPATRNAVGDVTLTMTCNPQVRPEQRAALLLGNQEVLAEPHPTQTDTLAFRVVAAAQGDYWIRLRLDGVDSLLVDRTLWPPRFDPTQKVTIV